MVYKNYGTVSTSGASNEREGYLEYKNLESGNQFQSLALLHKRFAYKLLHKQKLILSHYIRFLFPFFQQGKIHLTTSRSCLHIPFNCYYLRNSLSKVKEWDLNIEPQVTLIATQMELNTSEYQTESYVLFVRLFFVTHDLNIDISS